MRARRLFTLTLLAGLLLVPLAAGAESHEKGPKPLTWISYVMSQPGKGQALAGHIAKGGAEIYDGLMPDGHVLSWGVAMPINHRAGDDWNVMEYVSFRDWAAMDAFMQAFMAMQGAKSPEQLAAEQEEWYSLIEPGSHYDAIYQHQVFEVSATAGPPAYFTLGFHTPRSGQGGALVKQFQEYGQPVMAKLLAAGTINSYGLAAAALHGGPADSMVMWYGTANLAAQEAVAAGFEAVAAERGEEKEKKIAAKFAATVDLAAHHDRILVVVHSGGEGRAGEKPAQPQP